jgi:chromosome partitioning protein
VRAVLVANRKGGCGKTMTAITLASAFAAAGARVALADADPQKSALRWVRARPSAAAPVLGLDWTAAKAVGEVPKGLDWLVIDAPGALHGAEAEPLIAEADAVVVPVLPSAFDTEATRRFLKRIEEIGRVRKGRVGVHLVANRMRAGGRAEARLEAALAEFGRVPAARIADRAAYAELAVRGLGLFDRRGRAEAAMRTQWQPLLDALGAGGTGDGQDRS